MHTEEWQGDANGSGREDQPANQDIPHEPDDPDEVVRLTSAPNEVQARLWQQLLQERGIECQLVGDYLNIGFSTLSGLGPELWVHRRDAQRALAILEEHKASDTEGELSGQDPWTEEDESSMGSE